MSNYFYYKIKLNSKIQGNKTDSMTKTHSNVRTNDSKHENQASSNPPKVLKCRKR